MENTAVLGAFFLCLSMGAILCLGAGVMLGTLEEKTQFYFTCIVAVVLLMCVSIYAIEVFR